MHLTDVWDPARLLAIMTEHRLACGSGATYFLTSLLDHPDRTDDHLELMHFIGLGGPPCRWPWPSGPPPWGCPWCGCTGPPSTRRSPAATTPTPNTSGWPPTAGPSRGWRSDCSTTPAGRSARRAARGDLVTGTRLLHGLHRPGAHRSPVRRRRLVPDRGRRRAGPGRIPQHHRPEEGRHHPRGRERQRRGGRGAARDRRRRGGGGRGRRTPPPPGRAGLRLRPPRPRRRAGRPRPGPRDAWRPPAWPVRSGPNRCCVIDELPRTPSGKVKKEELRRRLRQE